MPIENAFADPANAEIQETTQAVCCFNVCPPIQELNDDQFQAVVLWFLNKQFPDLFILEGSPADVAAANDAAWCAVNMDTLCSFPPDKMKALILYGINQALTA